MRLIIDDQALVSSIDNCQQCIGISPTCQPSIPQSLKQSAIGGVVRINPAENIGMQLGLLLPILSGL